MGYSDNSFDNFVSQTYWFLFAARTFFNAFREDHELMHSRDVQKLEGVLSQSHLEVKLTFHYIFI